MEKEITLEELSQRHPEATKGFNQLEVVPEPPQSPPPDGGVFAKFVRLSRETIIGIAATILVLWIGYYIPMLLP